MVSARRWNGSRGSPVTVASSRGVESVSEDNAGPAELRINTGWTAYYLIVREFSELGVMESLGRVGIDES